MIFLVVFILNFIIIEFCLLILLSLIFFLNFDVKNFKIIKNIVRFLFILFEIGIVIINLLFFLL